MFDLFPKPDHQSSQGFSRNRQQRLMLGALALLLATLGMLLYHERDFWFPETSEAEDETEAAPANPPSSPAVASEKTSHIPKPPAKAAPAPAPPLATVTRRTVLPPLEVEVVAGDVRSTLRPGSNSVHVDLKPGSPPQAITEPNSANGAAGTTAGVTSEAAERVQISPNAADVVSHPVSPGYPLLARQMKVQGSVVLRALIGRDGVIQDLHVLSGAPILASAAEEAVRQWHFKPHYEGQEAVETQAKITVNFTISTN